jgi:hypothetical protein
MSDKTAEKPAGSGAKAMFETWEKAAGAWWDAWAQSPAFVGAAARVLESQLAWHGALGSLADAIIPAWRLPAARDVAQLSERVAALEARLAKLEAGIGPEKQ